ncbi:MAG: Prevent-host-death family protein [Candidatus Woesebacteria bacterium GW2011_GWB1_39_10b]|uniref:Antitoxin n=2 Tax=Candidatus Woeseibacteriota TaxID=1752722 RepID=A0A0G0N9C4_9BACT|nr:MAG: Prevent-host-death family protein [Microgenomates group bacterium GW2011_GWC1_38_12]KKQ93339.1 MAG: Prevent-host-death family protein [Candidatus Woesebacteria bacterium GW2011_GWB1_39_10b]KKR12063.1 MAG: Prevent-host-death family protein [Candidatus Woesebacteria bacterium GW2011_GWA1_39_21b]
MMTIPYITTVADLQRKYRSLVDKIRKTGEPLLVVNRGRADVVVMDASTYEEKMTKLRQLEEEYLLKVMQEGIDEYKKGKTVKLQKGKTLLDLLQ